MGRNLRESRACLLAELIAHPKKIQEREKYQYGTSDTQVPTSLVQVKVYKFFLCVVNLISLSSNTFFSFEGPNVLYKTFKV